MEIGIIHLTDLHIEEKTNILDKINSLIQATKNEFSNINNRYLVITGDIANKGNKNEYGKAKELITKINKELEITKIIIVPGNHDCNFEYNNQIRRNCVLNPDYSTIGEDDSVIKQAITIQKDFWEFYSEYNKCPNDKLVYQISDIIDGINICFYCFNTAWMSSIEEKPGNLFFPVKKLNKEEKENNLAISVFHHPLNWFSPNKEINNKNEFQDYLDNISNMKLIGHEHENKSTSVINLDTNLSTLELSGEIFNDDNKSHSGFQLMKIKLNKEKLFLKKFKWSNNLYVSESGKEISLQRRSHRKLKIQDLFFKNLNDIKIPLLIDSKNITLSDIYVFPDLEAKKEDYKELESYIDAQRLLSDKTYKKIVLDGDSQIGKTSLLNVLFKKFYDKGKYPFLLNGKDINDTDIDKIIKKKFHKIYCDECLLDRYLQIEKIKKVLLIDDFHRSKLNPQRLKQFITEVTKKYEIVIVTTDSATELSADTQTIFNEFHKLEIKPLGYKKTDDLIIKYFRCKSDFLSLNDQEKMGKIKITFNQVRNLLGDKILPSYPIFILSLLRTLDEATYSLNETSYGYCYESLLYFAFKSKAKLQENELTYYLSFIEQLAFTLFNSKKKEFVEDFFYNFYKKYKEEHIIDDFSVLRKNLIDSYILKEYDSTYKFGYKYIFYFLVAKHIAGIINKDEGKKIVNDLFENLHIEENANILVFITHHTKDIEFIEESVLRAMEPFEKVEPITLHKDCSYYSLISGLAENVTKEIIKSDVNPIKHRKEHLRNIDDNKTMDLNYEINEHFRPYIKAFKSIDIVSQIIKNRLGYLKKDEILTYIKELYLTGFRMIGAIGETYKKEKNEIINDITTIMLDTIEKKAKGRNYLLSKSIDREKIKQEVNKFFEIINLQICLSIFSKLVDAVGIKDNKMKDLYTTVATKINTPAANLVSFSIKSYYYGVSVEEIKELAQELKRNPVALKILKARVISYVYNNYLDFRKKQQISNILNLELRHISKKLK